MEETPHKQIEMANLKKEQASNSLSTGQTIVTDIKPLSGCSGTGWQRETGTGGGGPAGQGYSNYTASHHLPTTALPLQHLP